MEKVLPLIIICAVGIALCIAYITYVFVRALRRKFGKNKDRFEIEDDVLTIKLDSKRRRKP